MDSAPSNATTQKSENQKSVKVLDELLNQLTISKTADETSAATSNIATFINGDIEEHDAPTKWAAPPLLRNLVHGTGAFATAAASTAFCYP